MYSHIITINYVFKLLYFLYTLIVNYFFHFTFYAFTIDEPYYSMYSKYIKFSLKSNICFLILREGGIWPDELSAADLFSFTERELCQFQQARRLKDKR